MANKKINELDSRSSLSLSDLMAVGDPSTGYLYKTTISDLKTLTGAGVISFNGRFGAVSPAEGDYTLTQLSDVIITTAANGNIIKYNGSNWVNVPMYTGTIAQYVDGTGAYQTFPTLLSSDRLVTEVRNTSGATMTKGTVVYLNGSSGTLPTIAKAKADAESTSTGTYGVVQNDIANNANGYVVVIGNLTGIDTSAYSAGAILWLSPTTAGGFTTTKPVAPNNAVYVGIVTRSNNTQGTIEVKIQNGYELEELHNVLITSAANNDGLFWESSTSLWKNKSISTVLGYTPANASSVVPNTRTLTINGTAYDLSADRTWTIPTHDAVTIGTANGLSLSGQALSLALASTSATGALSSTDWNTFNGKQNAITLTTTGTSGAATLVGSTLNIPNYTTDLSGYVPYTGATNNVNLGENDLFSRNITNKQIIKIDGYVSGSSTLAGALGIKTSSAGFTYGGTGYISITSNDTNALTVVNESGVWSKISFNSISSNRTFTFPNASGTIALTSDIPTVAGVYLPLAGGTLTGALSGTRASFSQSTSVSSVYGYNGFTGGTGIEGGAGNGEAGYFSNNSTTYPVIELVSLSATKFIRAINSSAAEVFNISSTGGGYFAGSVGIGTTSPSYKLSVVGPNGGTAISWTDNINNTGYLSIRGTAAAIGADNNLLFETAATERMRITSGGTLLLGRTTLPNTNYKFIANVGSDLNIAFGVQGGESSIESFNDAINQSKALRIYGYPLYLPVQAGDTTGSGANMYIDGTTGRIYRSTSSLKYKNNVENYTKGLAEVMQMRPVTYNSKNENETQTFAGFIAEEIHDLGLAEFVQYAEDETPDALSYGNMVSLLVKAIQEQQAQIEDIKARLN
jgi:hypothetical protein